MSVYVFCDDDGKHKSMSEEQILSAIAQAQGGMPVIDPDAGILTKVKETNTGGYITFWVGSQAQYNALNGAIVPNRLYIITDETTQADIEDSIAGINTEIENLRQGISAVSSTYLHSYSMALEEGQAIAPEVASSIIEAQYCSKIARVFFKGNVSLKGSMSAGQEIIFTYPAGVYVPREGDWCVLTCVSDQSASGAFIGRVAQTAPESPHRIILRAVDGFKDATVRVYMEGTFFSSGGIKK